MRHLLTTTFLIILGLFFWTQNVQAGVIGRAPNNLGLVGYWSFNDATSTTRSTLVQDFSGNNNNGVMTNMANPATAASGVANGRLGKALSFDGSDDFVDAGDINALDSVGVFTLVFWGKKSQTTQQVVVSKYTDSDNRVNLAMWTDGILYFTIGNAGANWGSIAFNNTEWNHFAMVFDGSQTGNANRLKGYINGIGQTLTFAGTIPSTTANHTGNFEIGRLLSTNYSAGLIDEVRIYNRALSADEVRALYNSR